MIKKLVKNALLFDAIFNLLLGIVILLFYKHIEALISASGIMSTWLWLVIGMVLLSYGIWQSITIYKNRIGKSVELISGMIAWLFFLILGYALLFPDLDIYPTAYIILWITNGYIFLGGVFFIWAYKFID